MVALKLLSERLCFLRSSDLNRAEECPHCSRGCLGILGLEGGVGRGQVNRATTEVHNRSHKNQRGCGQWKTHMSMVEEVQ